MRVVELELTDSGKNIYAIRMDDGTFYGQKWIDDDSEFKQHRTYPYWSTRKLAQRNLKGIIDARIKLQHRATSSA